MSCLLAEVQLRLRRRLSPDCYCTVVNWVACGAAQFIKWISFFCRGRGGGGVVFLGSRSGSAPSASSNLYTTSEQCL